MRRSSAPSQKPAGFTYNNALSKDVSGQTQSEIRSSANILELLNREPNENEEPDVQDNDDLLLDGYIRNTNVVKEVEKQKPVNTDEVLSSSNNNARRTHDCTTRLYNVVYGKQSKKKHKTWEGDGVLEVDGASLTLKDEDGKVLGRGSGKKLNIEEGLHLYVGSKEVEILDEIKKPNSCNLEKKRQSESDDNLLSSGEVPPKKLKKSTGNTKFKFISPLADRVVEIQPLVMPQPDHEHQWKFNTSKSQLKDVIVDRRLTSQLRPHQKDGIVFLYRCIVGLHNHQYTGAILADEMGLGKTLQSISLIWTLMKQGPYGSPLIKRTLIVTPSSLVENWKQEFTRWLGKDSISVFIVDQKNKPADFIKDNRFTVLIISYEMFVRYNKNLVDVSFDLVICDEGHRLKNNNIRTSLLLNQLECKKRILLTGTPIQNDLQEFHALVDFVNPGILGPYNEFRKAFEEPIVMSRQLNADKYTVKKGEEKAKELNFKTSGFILRRTQSLINKFLPSKHEAVIFCLPSDLQKTLYKAAADFWESRLEKSDTESQNFSHLSVIMAMKKISNHPSLVRIPDDTEASELSICLNQVLMRSSEGAVEESNKLKLITCLFRNLKQINEKVVIVSYFTQTLDMITEICDHYQYNYCRLDGATPSSQRINIVNKFNSNHSTDFVFLLSGKAGGTGLNLIGASRLVLFDSDWNPASDLQAMARVWRDGQKKSVYIYRLVNTGTIEEKIFQRQLSKAALSETVVDIVETNSTVRLSREELKDLFTLHNTDCLTHDLMACDCSGSGEKLLKDTNVENTNNDCQLTVDPERRLEKKGSLRMNQLFQWEHHARPFKCDLIKEMALSGAENDISFIFHNVSTKDD